MIPKFRAWHKEDSEMIKVGEMDFNLHSIYYNMANISFDDFHIMQSTGLRDMRENEICEGDIVLYPHEFHAIRVIKWENGAFRVVIPGLHSDKKLLGDCNEELTVLGDIYQDTELLEG